jgi:hypothetical protein
MTDTSAALPCAACKQPVIEKRTLDGALVVLDAGTRRVHLCVKRKEVEAARARQVAASRPKKGDRPAPRPPVKRAAASRPVEPPRKAARQRPRKATLRSPEQVTEMLKGRIVRWRTGDGPTSFCDTCGAPVLVGFSHVRWDVIVVDAAGHTPHDCAASRQAAAALRAQASSRGVDVPALPAVESDRVPARTLAPVTPAAPIATAQAKPRRRPALGRAPVAANSCESCGNLKASVNGQWVCLHCA